MAQPHCQHIRPNSSASVDNVSRKMGYLRPPAQPEQFIRILSSNVPFSLEAEERGGGYYLLITGITP